MSVSLSANYEVYVASATTACGEFKHMDLHNVSTSFASSLCAKQVLRALSKTITAALRDLHSMALKVQTATPAVPTEVGFCVWLYGNPAVPHRI